MASDTALTSATVLPVSPETWATFAALSYLTIVNLERSGVVALELWGNDSVELDMMLEALTRRRPRYLRDRHPSFPYS